jgi:hypothetical protein
MMLLFVHSFGCAGGFASCVEKMKITHVVVGDTLYIPISATQTLVYSKKPIANAIKHDPFLSLYLVEAKSKYFFKLNKYLSLGEAVVNEKMALEIKIREPQFGLNKLATLNQAAFAPGLLLNSCCFIEGIVTPRGVIEKEYIARFLNTKELDYGDAGVQLEVKNKECVVVAKDPFSTSSPFEIGDVILLFDGKKMACHKINQNILFAKIGSSHKLRVKRGAENLDLSTIVKKRYGGGALSDTFLESRGIYLDKSLHVIRVEEKAKPYGLLLGDLLLGANGTKVSSQQELQKALSTPKDGVNLLLQRTGFQFFVQIN